MFIVNHSHCLLKLLSAVVLAFPLAVAANSEPEPDAVKQLAARLAALGEMQSAFTQELIDSDGELLDQSSGWMAWQRPDQFRWEVVQPLEQTILIKGDTYYQFDRDLDQLMIEALSDDIAMLPSLLLNGDIDAIDQNYTVSVGDAASFALLPKAQQSLFSRIMLKFLDGRLVALEIVDDLEQVSRFQFQPMAGRELAAETLFEIVASDTTDIIRQ